MRTPFLAAIDTAATAKGLEERPWPFFLALVIGALGILWAAYVHTQWASARRERDLLKQFHQNERERSHDLRKERDAERERGDKIHADHLRDLVKVVMAAEGLIRMRDELQAKRDKRDQKDKP